MTDEAIQVVLEEKLDSSERARIQTRRQRFERNWAWLEAHASEVYSHRGKFVCIAGEELFVADTLRDVVERARAAHPQDDGHFTRFVPKEKGLLAWPRTSV